MLFGLAAIGMGALILGALWGWVPTDGGQFLAPTSVILSLGLGLVLFGVLLVIPVELAGFVRGALFLLVMILVAVVCNWTAFAPEVVYTSTTTLGSSTTTAEDPIGGRIVFTIAALVVDGILIFSLIGWIKNFGDRDD
jgi:cytochrome c oxidase assembly factor CtaG